MGRVVLCLCCSVCSVNLLPASVNFPQRPSKHHHHHYHCSAHNGLCRTHYNEHLFRFVYSHVNSSNISLYLKKEVNIQCKIHSRWEKFSLPLYCNFCTGQCHWDGKQTVDTVWSWCAVDCFYSSIELWLQLVFLKPHLIVWQMVCHWKGLRFSFWASATQKTR